MNDQQRWTHLAGLEEEAQNLLGWDIMKIAKSNQHELEMAISQFQLQRKEDDHKHDMDQQTRIDDEKMTIVDLRSHHTPEIRMNATINEHLLDQLIACYCASSPIPVTAASIERCLFYNTRQKKKIKKKINAVVMNRERAIAGAMIACADITNVVSHIIHPTNQHSIEHSCLICGNSASTKIHNPNTNSKSCEMNQILAKPTSSDLDLQSTGTDAVRKVMVFGLDVECVSQSETNQLLLRWISDLTLHVGYSSQFKRTKQDAEAKYHSLILFFVHFEESHCNQEWKDWMRSVVAQSARVVIISSNESSRFFNECFSDYTFNATKITMLYYSNLQMLLRVLLHASMTTHHRVSTNDLQRLNTAHDNLFSIVASSDRQSYLFF